LYFVLSKKRGGEGKLMVDFVSFGTLFVGVVTLIVAVLAMRSAQGAARLAVQRNEYLKEDQERLALLSEERRSLYEELKTERQHRRSLQEELNYEHQQRLEAEERAEWAEQEALKGAAQQLRQRMDRYLNELEEKEDTHPGGIRRVK
jgi:biopolymer transport protein ExbB/TolQ